MRPPWDATINDLSVHRATQHELQIRRQRLQSSNTQAARNELASKRKPRSQSFDVTLAYTSGDESADALRELDAVEAELQRLATETNNAPHIPPKITRPPLAALDVAEHAGEGGCITPPTPALGGLPPSAPWATLHRNGAADAPADAREHAGELRNGSSPTPDKPVVDLNEEIAMFHKRTDDQHSTFSHFLEADRVAMPRPTTPIALRNTREFRLEQPPARRTGIQEVRHPGMPASAAEQSPRTACAQPPWRPANGKVTSQPVTGNISGRSPDTLGLSRMQHACGELHSLVSSYESARQSRDPNDGDRRPSTADGSLKGARNIRGVRAADSSAGFEAPASFGACNAQLVELTSRLVAHLQRADSELREQAALRTEAERQLQETRSAFAHQSDEMAAELASLRREARLTKEAHEAQFATLQSQLSSLLASRNTNFLASMATTLQHKPNGTRDASASAAPDGPSALQGAAPSDVRADGGRRTPSLFSPVNSPAAGPMRCAADDDEAVDAGSAGESVAIAMTPASNPIKLNALEQIGAVDAPPSPEALAPPPYVAGLLSYGRVAAPPLSPFVKAATSSTIPGRDEQAAKEGGENMGKRVNEEVDTEYGVDNAIRRVSTVAHGREPSGARQLERAAHKRSSAPLAPGVLPSAALPTVVRFTIGGHADRVAVGGSGGAKTSERAKGGAAGEVEVVSSCTPPARPLTLSSDESSDTGDVLFVDRVARAQLQAQTNEARSNALLQAYCEEKSSRRGKAQLGDQAATGVARRTTTASRLPSLTMEPTQLFPTEMPIAMGGEDQEPTPNRGPPTAMGC